jgi:hypothetical protein
MRGHKERIATTDAGGVDAVQPLDVTIPKWTRDSESHAAPQAPVVKDVLVIISDVGNVVLWFSARWCLEHWHPGTEPVIVHESMSALLTSREGHKMLRNSVSPQELIHTADIPLSVFEIPIQSRLPLLDRLLAPDHLPASLLNQLCGLSQILNQPEDTGTSRASSRSSWDFLLRLVLEATAERHIRVEVEEAGLGLVRLPVPGRGVLEAPVEDRGIELLSWKSVSLLHSLLKVGT